MKLMRFLNSMRKIKGEGIVAEIQSAKLVNRICNRENLQIYIFQGRIINQNFKVLFVQGRKISIELNFLIILIRKSNQREDRNRQFTKTMKIKPHFSSQIFDNFFPFFLFFRLLPLFFFTINFMRSVWIIDLIDYNITYEQN